MEEEELARKFGEYLEGGMPAEEREAFARELAAEPAFVARLQEERLARHVVTVAGREELKVQLADFEKEWQDQRREERVAPARKPWYWGGMLGLALALLALLGWWVCPRTPTEPEGIFAAHFTAYPPPFSTRGRAPELLVDWAAATNAYTEEDYATAATLFTGLTADTTLAYLAHFYTGASLLAQQPPRARDAINALESTLTQDSDYLPAARWYLALAYLEAGDIAMARRLLEAIVAERAYQHEGAATILAQLRD